MKESVTLAAQADLVLLTVDMLKLPPIPAERNSPSWFEFSTEQLDELLKAALGAASTRVFDDSLGLTPRVALAEVVRCAGSLGIEDWKDENTRLFDGATACPLNQASYVRRDKGKILGDVSAFYNAFGWRGRVDTGERPIT